MSNEWISTDYWPNERANNPEEIQEALKILRDRIEQRFPKMTGNKQQCIEALSCLEFWSTPLQDKGESSGFDDYLGFFIQENFMSEEHRKSWETGFIKAHLLTAKRFANEEAHVIVLAHAKKLIENRKKADMEELQTVDND